MKDSEEGVILYHSVAIIGSFQKFYQDVKGLIKLFRDNGFFVTSPFDSQITESREAFVIFADDNRELSNDEIQTDTLRKILNADAVYVYNPVWRETPSSEEMPGYVGKTTCYEIGILMAKNRPLYYMNVPFDLPVPVTNEQLISPQEFIKKFKSGAIAFHLPKKEQQSDRRALKAVFEKPSLVICGSMTFYSKMKELKEELWSLGIDAEVPEDETELPQNMTDEAFAKFKRKVSKSYFKKIREAGTIAILVVNEEKRGIPNYIGANTLVEAGMAISWGRRVFIYNNIYEPLEDELIAWDAVAIHRDLQIIKHFFDKEGIKPDAVSGHLEQLKQYSLFDFQMTVEEGKDEE